ncbi:hypothetical protein BVC93_00815 [Mycobacterium sp. MS1601]|uniref:hypothetical protein n=1 Tax=Mycobacterium sp. MS1601 TaxID=1936029 RepID=UPI0009796102|nr:hypothetical protein [Mycobacterium sp. MS1601]AQA01203.1 hypothetical protein BVC93_00815 [Mycobacterium sp. MS1601]
MNLLPSPDVTITDADVTAVLNRAVRVIGPVLDLLWDTDPLNLKRRTCDDEDGAGALDKIADAVSWVLNAADVPGTLSWDEMDADARIDWWVHRVGALNTVLVAWPGVFGVLAGRLPVQDLLGFTNQAMVMCAVARELGVTDPDRQVRMLGAVLCGRELDVADGADPEPPPALPRTPAGLAKALWQLWGLFGAISEELGRRPHPRAVFRYLGMVPAVGAVAAYLGELGALARAAKRARAWINQSSQAVERR